MSSKKRQVMHMMGRPKPELMVDATVVLQLNHADVDLRDHSINQVECLNVW